MQVAACLVALATVGQAGYAQSLETTPPARNASAPVAAGAPSPESKPWWIELANSSIFDTVLDKGLLALLIAYFGFILNGALERLKSEESLSSGLTDIRLKKVGEMSEAAYGWESEVVESVELLKRNVKKASEINQAGIVRAFAPDRTRLAEEGRKCLSALARDRFWVGDGLYDEFAQFYRRVAEALDNVVDVSSLADFDVVRKESHVNATQAMKTFIADHVRMRAQWSAAARGK